MTNPSTKQFLFTFGAVFAALIVAFVLWEQYQSFRNRQHGRAVLEGIERDQLQMREAVCSAVTGGPYSVRELLVQIDAAGMEVPENTKDRAEALFYRAGRLDEGSMVLQDWLRTAPECAESAASK